MYDDYEPVEYYIPVNLEDDGNLLSGNIEKKNLVETVVIFIVTMAVWMVFTYPFGMTIKVIVFCVLVLPPTALAVVGINNESFLEYVIELFFFRKKQRIAKFRLPMNVAYEEEKIKEEELARKGEKGHRHQEETNGVYDMDDEPLTRREKKAMKKAAKKEAKRQKKLAKQEDD